MAAVDPYGPCPCGSGEKYKWCCQKAEPFAERAQRAAENGQLDAAMKALDEGLKAQPESPWLNLRKALVLARREQVGPARECVRKILGKRPKHAVAHATLVRLALQADGPAAAAGVLQEALEAVGPGPNPDLAEAAELVGAVLADTGRAPAAIAHLTLAAALDPEEAEGALQSLRMIETNPALSPWLRNPYRLAPVPEGLDAGRAGRFAEALARADQGRWAPAAAAFDALSQEGTPESDRNLGLCRLWLGDAAGAVTALRRYTGWIGATPENVDLEALCQLVAPVPEFDRVELLQWIWEPRDCDGLRARLGAEPRAHAEGKQPIDPDDPDSPEVDVFLLLDRPAAPAAAVAGPGDVPRVEGRLLLGQEIVALEAFDDGRLDRLADWFRRFAGEAIPPAHPRTKSVGRATRSGLALRTEWLLPEGLDPATVTRLTREERRRVLTEAWPDLPLPGLGGRSPRQAARAGDAALALRAALCLIEVGHEAFDPAIDFAALRSELGVEPEPTPDPTTVDVAAAHLARLHRIPAAELDDARLLVLYERAHRYVLPQALEQAATALVARPAALERPEAPPAYVVYGDLAMLALGRGQRGEALELVARGRQADPPARRATNALPWDLLELRLRARVEPPEQWVPHLAATLERHRDAGEAASPVLLTTLVQMGLVQLVPNPDRPGEMYLDTRRLQAILARYGPRITTAGGELGVTAAKGGLWTPGADAGAAPGGLWTPGAPRPAAPPAGGKSGLILPGR